MLRPNPDVLVFGGRWGLGPVMGSHRWSPRKWGERACRKPAPSSPPCWDAPRSWPSARLETGPPRSLTVRHPELRLPASRTVGGSRPVGAVALSQRELARTGAQPVPFSAPLDPVSPFLALSWRLAPGPCGLGVGGDRPRCLTQGLCRSWNVPAVSPPFCSGLVALIEGDRQAWVHCDRVP